jgi:8-oxo-dGTP pyrophosphatase MutT (NUDIX family)
VLLNLRSADKQVHAGKWAFFGGRAEPEDADLVATWCREMHEELGAVVDPAAVEPLRDGVFDDGVRWAELCCSWPSTDGAFVLTEGQAYAWFTVDEALAGPDLAAYVPESLRLFRGRLAADEVPR